MSDDHGGACCEECAAGRKCAGDSCGLAKAPGATVKGAMRVPAAFQVMPAGQAAPFAMMAPKYGAPYGVVAGAYPNDDVRVRFKGYGTDYGIGFSDTQESAQAARLLSGTRLTCETYLALSQERRQNALALKYYGLRTHVGEPRFNTFHTAMDALNPAEQRQALADVAWLNQHCVGVEARRIAQVIRETTVKAAGQGSVGQGFIGASVGMGSVGQGYIGRQLFPSIGGYTFGSTPYPWNAMGSRLAPYNAIMPAGQGYEGMPGSDPLSADQTAAIDAALMTGDPLQIDAALRAQPRAPAPNAATPWLNLAGQTINASTGVIIAAINGQNQAERDRLTNETRLQIARLTMSRPVSDLERQQQAQTLAALAQLQQQLYAQPPAPVDHTALYVGAAVVVAVGIGVIAVATRGGTGGGRRATDARANPVIGGRDNKHGRWVQPKRGRSRRRARARA